MDKITLEAVKNWVENFVIDYQLCPFARKVYLQNRIRFLVENSADTTEMMTTFVNEMAFLKQISSENTDTTILIFPNGLDDFNNFLDFVAMAQHFLEELGHEEDLQIATFHPAYQFEETLTTSAENYTNRAHYQILHVVREKSMANVLENYENPDLIPIKNIALMNKIGAEQLEKMLKNRVWTKKDDNIK